MSELQSPDRLLLWNQYERRHINSVLSQLINENDNVTA